MFIRITDAKWKTNDKEYVLKLLEEDSIEFDEIKLNNELIAKFHSSGLVPSINISISDLDLFFEKRRVQFEQLISRHLDIIKK